MSNNTVSPSDGVFASSPPRRRRETALGATVRCQGRPFFRSPSVRDYACLLDVDPDVISWACRPPPIRCPDLMLQPDFAVVHEHEEIHVVVDDSGSAVPPEDWRQANGTVQVIDPQSFDPDRLANARDLLRYAFWRVSMSDRIRILATLGSEGSLTLGECLTIRTSCDTIAAIAALALRREVDLDLDSGRIGPETRVSRFRG